MGGIDNINVYFLICSLSKSRSFTIDDDDFPFPMHETLLSIITWRISCHLRNWYNNRYFFFHFKTIKIKLVVLKLIRGILIYIQWYLSIQFCLSCLSFVIIEKVLINQKTNWYYSDNLLFLDANCFQFLLLCAILTWE